MTFSAKAMFSLEPAAFQHAFGALLADSEGQRLDPALARALTIHRNTATKAAADALGDNFPVVRALVGESPFAAAALAYVDARPPAEPRLCDYGAHFPDFLVAYPPFGEVSYLPDCARVDRAVVEALFAADARPATGDDFGGGIDPDLTLRLHPATRRVSCSAPAASIWRAHQPDPDTTLEVIEWRAEVCLITRPANAVLVQALEPAAAAFLAAVEDGQNLGEAAEAASAHGDLATAFFTLLAAGALRSPAE
jgi:Putative DNA-binding domain